MLTTRERSPSERELHTQMFSCAFCDSQLREKREELNKSIAQDEEEKGKHLNPATGRTQIIANDEDRMPFP